MPRKSHASPPITRKITIAHDGVELGEDPTLAAVHRVDHTAKREAEDHVDECARGFDRREQDRDREREAKSGQDSLDRQRSQRDHASLGMCCPFVATGVSPIEIATAMIASPALG